MLDKHKWGFQHKKHALETERNGIEELEREIQSMKDIILGENDRRNQVWERGSIDEE